MQSSIVQLLMQQPVKDKPPYSLNEWLYLFKDQQFPVRSGSLTHLKKHISYADATIEHLQTKSQAESLVAFDWLNQVNKVIPNKRGEIFWLIWSYAYPVMERLPNKLITGGSIAHPEISVLGYRIHEITVHLCKKMVYIQGHNRRVFKQSHR